MNKKVFITLSFFAITYWLLFDFLREIEFDTKSFIAGARLLFGSEGGENLQARISKPLVLLLPGLMEKLSGLNPKYVFLLQSIVCFYLCGWLIYKIIFQITGKENTACIGMLAYIFCSPFAVHSLFVQSDVAGWLFELWAIHYCLKHFSNESATIKQAIALGLIIGLGCLVKESAIIGLIFFYLLLFDIEINH